MASKYVLQTQGRSQSGSNCSIIKLFGGGNGFHYMFNVLRCLYAMQQSSEFTTLRLHYNFGDRIIVGVGADAKL